MPALQLIVTTAGLDALVDAQSGATDPITVAEIGLSTAAFVAAPTLEAIPGEIKRINAIAGTAASETIIHMVAQDSSTDVYTCRGIGLYLADGTLFAVYSQADPIVNKVSIAAFLIAFDIAFINAVDVAIEFGDASFINPPATETTKGVAFVATNAKADAGVDDESIMTPKKVKRVLDAFTTAMNAAWAAFQATINGAIATLQGRTITGGGLASGGGDLTANRVISVVKATDPNFLSGTGDGVITAQLLSSLDRVLAQTGRATLPGTAGLVIKWGRFTAAGNTTTNCTFIPAFANECFVVVIAGGQVSASAQDNWVNLVSGSETVGGFQVSNGRGSSYSTSYIAIGN